MKLPHLKSTAITWQQCNNHITITTHNINYNHDKKLNMCLHINKGEEMMKRRQTEK